MVDRDGETEAGGLTCAGCGAAWREGQTCQSVYDQFLTWEFADPAYGAVHFYTVAVFMTQHGRYSDEAQDWIRGKLRENLEESASFAWIARAAQPRSANRTWPVLRPPEAPPAKRVPWEMTIVDVAREHAAAGGGSERYRDLVTEWARTTLRQLEAE